MKLQNLTNISNKLLDLLFSCSITVIDFDKIRLHSLIIANNTKIANWAKDFFWVFSLFFFCFLYRDYYKFIRNYLFFWFDTMIPVADFTIIGTSIKNGKIVEMSDDIFKQRMNYIKMTHKVSKVNKKIEEQRMKSKVSSWKLKSEKDIDNRFQSL